MLTWVELQKLEEQKAGMTISDEGTIREYYDLRKQLDGFTDDMKFVMTHPDHCIAYLQPGRLVHIKHQDYDFGWGPVVNFKQRRPPKNSKEELPPNQSYVVDVLLRLAEGPGVATKTSQELPPGVRPPKDGEETRMEVVPITLSCIQAFGHLRIFLPKDLKPVDARKNVGKALTEVQKRFPDGLAVLDPIENMGIKDDGFKKLLRVRAQPPGSQSEY